jgi:branched-chain amino acid transport system ATP-binding protein
LLPIFIARRPFGDPDDRSALEILRWPISPALQRSMLARRVNGRQTPTAVTAVTTNDRKEAALVTSPNDAPILAISQLDVVYGGANNVLKSVELHVPTGAVVAILGANGAGKTTLLRAISGLLGFHGGKITGGEITFRSTPSTGMDSAQLVRAGLAQVMEGRRIFPELSVDDNLRAGAFTRRDRSEIAATYERVLQLFPILRERNKQTAGYMSGGEQQMLAIGRALMAEPKLLLLDEPSLGLAPLIVEQIFEIIREVNQQGTSVLIVEQNAAMALRNSTYAYVMETGRIATSGPSAELLDDPVVQSLYLGGESAHASFRALKSYRRKEHYLA